MRSMTGPKPRSLDDKINKHLNVEAQTREPTICWHWLAAIAHGTSPVIRHGNKLMQVRRVLYQHHIGQLDPCQKTKGACASRDCVNPWHLALSTEFASASRSPVSTDDDDLLDMVLGMDDPTLDLVKSRPWSVEFSDSSIARAIERATSGHY